MNEAALLSTARALFGREVGFDEIHACEVTRSPAAAPPRLHITLELVSGVRLEARVLAGAHAHRAEAWLAALDTWQASGQLGALGPAPRPRPSSPDA